MSRHSSISSYYQPNSRSESPALFSSTSSSTSSNPQRNPHLHPQDPQQDHQPQTPSHHLHQQPSVQQPPAPRNQKADQILQVPPLF